MSTLDYQPFRGQRPLALSEWVAWGIVIAAILTILLIYAVRGRLTAVRKTEATRPDVRLLMSGRHLVGVHRLFPDRDLSREIRSLERSGNRLHIAILRWEIEGRDTFDSLLSTSMSQYSKLPADVQLIRDFHDDRVAMDSPEVREFRQRNGWFGDLALSHGKPAGDPLRASAMNAAMRTVASLVLFALSALAGGLAGLVLMIVGIVMLVQKKLTTRFTISTPPADRRVYLQGFAVYLGSSVCLGLIMRWIGSYVTIGMYGAFLVLPIAFVLGCAWPLMRGENFAQWRQTLGLHRGRGVFREMGAGVVGYLAGMPVIVVGILITLVLSLLTRSETSHPIVQEFTLGMPRIVLAILVASVWAPISEELIFRGMLFAHLRERFGFLGSAIGVAVIFAIVHPQGWMAVPALGAIAVVFAAIREWRGSIIGPMVAHSINNTAVMLMLAGAAA